MEIYCFSKDINLFQGLCIRRHFPLAKKWNALKDKSFIFEARTCYFSPWGRRAPKDIPSVSRFVLLDVFAIVLAAKSLESDGEFCILEFHWRAKSRSSMNFISLMTCLV